MFLLLFRAVSVDVSLQSAIEELQKSWPSLKFWFEEIDIGEGLPLNRGLLEGFCLDYALSIQHFPWPASVEIQST